MATTRKTKATVPSEGHAVTLATKQTKQAKQTIYGVGDAYIPEHGPFAGKEFHSFETYKLAIRSNYAEYRLRVAIGQRVEHPDGTTSFVPGIILGGTPVHPEVAAGHLRTVYDLDDQELAAHLHKHLGQSGFYKPLPPLTPQTTAADIIKAATLDTLAKVPELAAAVGDLKHLSRFKVDPRDRRIFIEGRQIKASFREAANTAFAADRWGATRKGTKSYLSERVFVVEDRIYLTKVAPGYCPLDPEAPLIYLTSHDVADEPHRGVVHFPDGQGGTNSALVAKEQVEGAVLRYTIRVHNDILDLGQWLEILELAMDQGLGASRSQSYGRFTVVQFDKIATNRPRRIAFRDLSTGPVAPPSLEDADDGPEAGVNYPDPREVGGLLAASSAAAD